MDQLANLVRKIGLELGMDPVQLCIDARFDSKESDHRKRLREEILKHLPPLGAQEQADLLNLAIRPNLENFDVSISHCPQAGGFVISPKGWFNGFDLELPERVAAHHVEKLSTPEELKILSDPADLWTAKEAAFKAFSKAQGLTLASDATIRMAKPAVDSVTEFEASSRHSPARLGRGWIFTHQNIRAAVFFLKSADPL